MKQAFTLTEREVTQAIFNYGIQIGAVLPGAYNTEISFQAGEAIVRYEPSKQEKKSDDPTP